MSLVLIVVLILVCAVGLPQTGWHEYGYGPSGAAGFLVLVLIVLLLMGRS